MKKTFKIEGMNCNSCAHLIESELKNKVSNISVSYVDEKAEIEFDESKINESEIVDIIEKLGYGVKNKIENEKSEIKSSNDTISQSNISESGKELSGIERIDEKNEVDLVENSQAEKESTSEDNIKKQNEREELIILKKVDNDNALEKEKSKTKPQRAKSLPKKKPIKEKTEKDGIADNKWIPITLSIIMTIFVLYYILGLNFNLKLSEINIPALGEKTSLILLFAAGLLTGLHCVSMCGGFVVSYTTKNALNGHKSFKQHLVYGSSKVLSYAVIGGIFGLIGGVIAFSTKLRGVVAILAGIFMVFYALSMFGVKFFRRFQLNPKFLTKVATRTPKGPYKGPFFTGLLNGLFIACGPLQAMYLYAAGTGNFLSGATSLTAFGLGTLPVMLGFGSLASAISHKTTRKILKISAIIVLILGLVMINRGLTLTGSSFTYNSIKNSLLGGTASALADNNSTVLNNGSQEIRMDVDAYGYKPNSFVLKRGVPVRWIINVRQLTGCNKEIVVPSYSLDIKLKQGENIVEFTPNKTGTITWSCWMGMIRGSFIVTETGQATQQEIKSATPKSTGGTCGCGGGVTCGG